MDSNNDLWTKLLVLTYIQYAGSCLGEEGGTDDVWVAAAATEAELQLARGKDKVPVDGVEIDLHRVEAAVVRLPSGRATVVARTLSRHRALVNQV